jgi:hypothetical protein
MIRNSRQNWQVGETVKVGFLSLTVCAAIPTPGDSMPDRYALTNRGATAFYSFVPHHGLVRHESLAEAMNG